MFSRKKLAGWRCYCASGGAGGGGSTLFEDLTVLPTAEPILMMMMGTGSGAARRGVVVNSAVVVVQKAKTQIHFFRMNDDKKQLNFCKNYERLRFNWPIFFDRTQFNHLANEYFPQKRTLSSCVCFVDSKVYLEHA